MSRLKRSFSQRRTAHPVPHQHDQQDFIFAGHQRRAEEALSGASVKRFIWRVMIESVVIVSLLVGTVFLTYKVLFDESDGPDPGLQQANRGLPVPGGAAAGGLHYIQLSPGLAINQADQTLTRLKTNYRQLLGNLEMSLRAQPAEGGAPLYYVVAGPLYSPVTAEDLCGQIEAQGRGDPCRIMAQARPAATGNLAAQPAAPAAPQLPAAAPAPAVAAPAPTGLDSDQTIVAMVQKRLREAGFQTGNLSGQLDPQTSASIRSYQVAYGLEPNGRITAELLDKLINQQVAAVQQPAAAPPVAEPPAPATGRITLPLDAATGPSAPPVQTQAQIAEQPAPTARLAAPALRPPVSPLTQRAEEFLSIGDFSSARLLFEQAFEQGDAAAAAGYAKTFDPIFYQESGVIGLNPDPEQAVEWYRKAIEAGDRNARPRLERLMTWLQRRSASNDDEARRVLEALQ